jgi:hypothetical protein
MRVCAVRTSTVSNDIDMVYLITLRQADSGHAYTFDAFQPATLMTFKMYMIMVVGFRAATIRAKAIGRRALVVGDFMKNTGFQKAVQGTVECYAVVLRKYLLELTQRHGSITFPKMIQHVPAAIGDPQFVTF